MIINAFPEKKDSFNQIMKNIQQIFHPKYSHLISSFKLNAEKNASDIDEAILKGLIKAKKESFEATIKLCLTWNRIDIARNYIFTPYLKDKIIERNCLPNVMKLAIEQDRFQFVELFLENGLKLKNFLSYEILLQFYKTVYIFCF